MSPVGKLIGSGVGLGVSVLVMVASAFMVSLMSGGMYAGNKHEVNVAGAILCASMLSGLVCLIGVVLSFIAVSRARPPAPPP
jgi:hypothetical protein